MKTLLTILLLCASAFAQEGYTLYYTDDGGTQNPDGSITIVPTLSISGNDGNQGAGYFDYCEAQEFALLMLNNNPWHHSPKYIGYSDPLHPDGRFTSIMLTSFRL